MRIDVLRAPLAGISWESVERQKSEYGSLNFPREQWQQW